MRTPPIRHHDYRLLVFTMTVQRCWISTPPCDSTRRCSPLRTKAGNTKVFIATFQTPNFRPHGAIQTPFIIPAHRDNSTGSRLRSRYFCTPLHLGWRRGEDASTRGRAVIRCAALWPRVVCHLCAAGLPNQRGGDNGLSAPLFRPTTGRGYDWVEVVSKSFMSGIGFRVLVTVGIRKMEFLGSEGVYIERWDSPHGRE